MAGVMSPLPVCGLLACRPWPLGLPLAASCVAVCRLRQCWEPLFPCLFAAFRNRLSPSAPAVTKKGEALPLLPAMQRYTFSVAFPNGPPKERTLSTLFPVAAAFGGRGCRPSAVVAAAFGGRGCALYGRGCALGGRGCVGCCIAATPPPCALPPQPCRSIGLRLPFTTEHVECVLGQGAHLVLPRVDMHGRHPFDALPQPRHDIA